MSIHDLNTLGILSIKEKQTLLDLRKAMWKEKKQAIWQSGVCHADLLLVPII